LFRDAKADTATVWFTHALLLRPSTRPGILGLYAWHDSRR
jgi:hypothetical protein